MAQRIYSRGLTLELDKPKERTPSKRNDGDAADERDDRLSPPAARIVTRT
jgi:hypothetical protein